MSELQKTKQWFEQAIPNPTIEQACIQIGCHYEEVGEMLAVTNKPMHWGMSRLANCYKKAKETHIEYTKSAIVDNDKKIELLDSLADQIVTAIGVAHMLGFDIISALEEVNRSNFSKFEDGKPVFDANGKITKGKHYSKPDLARLVK